MNYNNFFHIIRYSYDEQGNPLYRRYYNTNNSLVLTTKYDKRTDEWIRVRNSEGNSAPPPSPAPTLTPGWVTHWKEVSQKCPMISDDIEITSISISVKTVRITIRFLEISEYNISNSKLQENKDRVREMAKYCKKESNMPDDTSMIMIVVDKAEMELFRVIY